MQRNEGTLLRPQLRSDAASSLTHQVYPGMQLLEGCKCRAYMSLSLQINPLVQKVDWQRYLGVTPTIAVTHSVLTQSNLRALYVLFLRLLVVTVVAGAPL